MSKSNIFPRPTDQVFWYGPYNVLVPNNIESVPSYVSGYVSHKNGSTSKLSEPIDSSVMYEDEYIKNYAVYSEFTKQWHYAYKIQSKNDNTPQTTDTEQEINKVSEKVQNMTIGDTTQDMTVEETPQQPTSYGCVWH